MEDFFNYLGMALNFTAWALKNYDIVLGGLAAIVLCLNPGPEVPKFPMILMAIIGFGIRAARIYLKNRDA